MISFALSRASAKFSVFFNGHSAMVRYTSARHAFAAHLEGVSFEPLFFRPLSGRYASAIFKEGTIIRL